MTAALTAVLVASGCNPEAEEHATTPSDVLRAEQVWHDPWAAPFELNAPTSRYGSDGHVERSTGSREAAYDVGPVRAVLLEVRAALANDWRLVGADCDDDEVVAQLGRGSVREDGRLATVSATPEDDGAWSSVRVEAMVAHHADGSWPEAPAVSAARTCLRGQRDTPPTELPVEPLDGEESEDAIEDFEGWARDELDAEEAALLDAVREDPWFASSGAALTTPDLRTGDNRRGGARADGSRGLLSQQEVVAGMTRWELIWAACTRASMTLRLRLVTDHGVAVAELRRDPSTDGSMIFTVLLPVTEGPDAAWVAEQPTLGSSRCLSGRPPQQRLLIEGTTIGVTGRIQPMPS